MACLSPNGTDVNNGGHHRGMTTCHVMAILLLEMNRSLTDEQQDAGADEKFADLFGEDEGLINNLRLSRSDPILARKAAGNLHSLLQGYVHNMQQDLVDDIPQVPYSVYSRLPTSNSSESADSSTAFTAGMISTEAKPTTKRIADAVQDAFTSLGETIFATVTDAQNENVVGRDDLVKVLKRAIDHRDMSMIDFLPSFFEEGSATNVMALSTTELVWLHDWHKEKECTYGIAVDHDKEAVTVVFRGATTYADWDHSLHWSSAKIQNPVQGDYANKSDYIKLHGGYYKYLFRVRKDEKTTKYEEIARKVEQYGSRLGNYRLIVTGHSLGGALSTIFAFYASLEDRFVKSSPVQVVTFGCPKVCGYQFVDAIRHQEDARRLQIARFHNKKDSITHFPPNLVRYSKRGAKYYHIGLDVTLPYVRNDFFRAFGQPQPKVEFVDPESWWKSYRRQWMEFSGFNIPVRPWLLPYFHTLMEHQHRLLLADENHVLNKYAMNEFYEMREEFTANSKYSILAG